MALIETFILIGILIYLLYRWSVAKYGIWNERNIPHQKPKPLIGNFPLSLLMGKYSFLVFFLEQYHRFNGNKVYGVFNLRDGELFIRDPSLVKKICIKDFDSFMNHKNLFNDSGNEIFAKTLNSLRDRKWKEMRHILTPSFTGNKMRIMFELVNDCCLQAITKLNNELKMNEDTNMVDLEMKDYFTRFTNDVIASTAFGIKINSYENKTNDFYTIGNTLTKFKGLQLVKAILYTLLPKVMRYLRIKLFDQDKINYFKGLVLEAIKYRQQHNIIRPDMIHQLMEAKKQFENKKETIENPNEHVTFTDDDLLAQCILFFFAGFETVAAGLCFLTYELAVNADVQAKLYEEIKQVEESLNGQPLNYDILNKMQYLNMVVMESLRLWPPAGLTDRQCSTDYVLNDDDGNFVCNIKKDEVVFFPIIGYHRDPEYFPNPDKFDPERFTEENKQNMNMNVYMPFGIGPRNCIGNRFALMEIKSIIYHILIKYELVPGPKTAENLMNSLEGFQFVPKAGFWLRFMPRVKN